MRAAVLIGAIACFTACPPNGNPGGSPPNLFIDGGQDLSEFQGFAWDPEAFWMVTVQCLDPSMCPPAIESPGLPAFEASHITDAGVVVFDPDQGAPVAVATAPTQDDGSFTVEGVPSRAPDPYFLLAQGGTLFTSPDLPPIPPTNYQPTFSLQPIEANYPVCLVQQAPLIGDSGILAAVATHLSVTVADLLDPGQFGGVAIWWLYQPGLPVARLPAFDTGTAADQGTVLQMDWIDPGSPTSRSPRGFLVKSATDATSPIGLTVIVLPPSASGPTVVTFTPTDLTTDPNQGRPWSFGSIQAPIVPGLVSFIALNLFSASGPATTTAYGGEGPPPWLCLPL